MATTNCQRQNSKQFLLDQDHDATAKTSQQQLTAVHVEKNSKRRFPQLWEEILQGDKKGWEWELKGWGEGLEMEMVKDRAVTTKGDRGGPFDPWQIALESNTDMPVKGCARTVILHFHA